MGELARYSTRRHLVVAEDSVWDVRNRVMEGDKAGRLRTDRGSDRG